MFKKTLLALGLCLAVSASALAAVTEKVEQGNKYKLSYPVFKLENRAAAKAINKDIKRMVLEQKKLAKSKDPSYVEVGTNYEIFSETDDYVNIIFVKWDYMGGAHGMHYDHGLVYSKTTGERLPYTHFAKAITAGELYDAIAEHRVKVYGADLQTVSEAPFITYIKKDEFQRSEDYVLKDGKVYLMYPPYELDCYAVGTTYVELP